MWKGEQIDLQILSLGNEYVFSTCRFLDFYLAMFKAFFPLVIYNDVFLFDYLKISMQHTEVYVCRITKLWKSATSAFGRH